MKKSRRTREQIDFALRQAENGTPVVECRPLAKMKKTEWVAGVWLATAQLPAPISRYPVRVQSSLSREPVPEAKNPALNPAPTAHYPMRTVNSQHRSRHPCLASNYATSK